MSKNIPNPLYKYFPPERIDVLENEQIAVTPPNRFNDPFELSPHILPIKNRKWMKNHVRQALQMWKKNNAEFARRIPRKDRRAWERLEVQSHTSRMLTEGDSVASNLQDHLVGALSREIGFICLSAVWDSLLMWAHYCRDHQGFVLALDTTSPHFEALGEVNAIVYSDERPSFDAASGPKVEAYYIKSTDWSYEHEYRVFRMLENCGTIKYIDKKPVYLVPLPKACISAVYLGNRMNPPNKQRILRALNGTAARVISVELDRKRFALSMEDQKIHSSS